MPGIGQILALGLLYEIHDIHRFPSVQDFVSYCRLVKCGKESAGKHSGYSGAKIGNAHLTWAFSEAAVLSLRQNPTAQRFVARLAQQHGKPKALTILAHKLARTVYYMLRREQVFDATRFFAGTATPEPPVHPNFEPGAPPGQATTGAQRGARIPPPHPAPTPPFPGVVPMPTTSD